MESGTQDLSRGYDALAQEYILRRSREIGVASVRRWARALRPAGAVLDLGCGHGYPLSEALLQDGFQVYGVDASATMMAAYRERFPRNPAVCEAAEHSRFFDRSFDGVLAWGLLFLLEPDVQRTLIARVASVLLPGGQFLFTAPEQACRWMDTMTGRESVSLGRVEYRMALAAAGLTLVAEHQDEGGNHYYDAKKP